MTSKTHFSTVAIKTLNGAFEETKMNHRRDFLRENKLSLRDLQKTTSQKLTQQKQELENRQYKHLQKFHKSREQSLTRRPASQCGNSERNCVRQSRQTTKAINDCGGGGDSIAEKGGGERDKPNYLALRRAYSQQRHKTEQIQNIACCCCKQQQQQKSQTIEVPCYNNNAVPRSTSSVSVLSKAESCDKEIQTEDIHDEDFLYEALKKCSASDIHQIQKLKSSDQLIANSIPRYEPKTNSNHSREQVSHIYQDQFEDGKNPHEEMPQHSSRSQNACKLNGFKKAPQDEMVNGSHEDLDQHFQNIKITDDMKNNYESQLSARSRLTLCSTSTKRSIHKLGSREDIQLPRYLEKEKREKEEDRLRDLNKDPNCPLGHYALSEEQRLKALNNSQQKMADLISELNHMPMTMETLRIRKRKNEIEKELTKIEFDIRLFSKPKVYLTQARTQY